MVVRAMLLILGLFHVLNGLAMLADPAGWYASVPGVSETGPLNHHFITDVALAFLASGAGMILGASGRPWAGPIALAGATWPALHALFHVWNWFAMGFPRTLPMAVSEFAGVFGVSALGVVLALMRAREQGTV